MKFWYLIVALLLEACTPREAPALKPIPDDAELKEACGKHTVTFTNEATGMPASLNPGGTYYTTTRRAALSGLTEVDGKWWIQGGHVLTEVDFQVGVSYFNPFPLRIDPDGTCEVYVRSWHAF